MAVFKIFQVFHGVSLAQIAHPASANIFGEVSLQKLEIIVCFNFSVGGSGGKAYLFWDFAQLHCDLLYTFEAF